MAGDNIGASPLANGLFYEEPATIVTNLMCADFASVGNHEFDKGSAELLRIQNGGCNARRRLHRHAVRPCRTADSTNVYPGADFQYLSANVIVDDTGKTLFPAYGVKQIERPAARKFDVGFIGEVLRGHADHRHPDRRRRSDLPGRGRRRQQGRQGPQEARASRPASW